MVNEKNYITAEGFKILQDELSHIIKSERPALVKTISWAAGNGDHANNTIWQAFPLKSCAFTLFGNTIRQNPNYSIPLL